MMKKKVFALSLSACMFFAALPVYAEEGGSWKSNSSGWWYENADGTYPKAEFKDIDGATYYFAANGYMVTGWQNIEGEYYFFENSGAMKKSAWEKDYYLKEDGKMAKSEWVDDGKYYVDANGKWHQAHWESNSKGWWYVNEDTTYPINELKTIDGKTYYFGADGYMATGWQLVEEKYYYFEANGAMKTNAWQGNYYLGEDGAMVVSDWIDSDYYVGEDGKWIPAHWEEIDGRWKYDLGDGSRHPVGTYTVKGKEYYFDSEGFMVTGWVDIGSDRYFFEDSGQMKKSAWEGDYYLKDDGKMARSEWINGKYTGEYVGPDGKWIPGEWKQDSTGWTYTYGNGEQAVSGLYKIGNKTYYFYNSYMRTGWENINGQKYYFHDNGAMATGWTKLYGSYYRCDHWYYFDQNGVMATGWKKIDGSWYYFNKNTLDTGYMYYYGYYIIDGEYYWFKPNGQMITGWYHYNGERKMDGDYGFTQWVYCDANGIGHDGWLAYNGDWYCFDDGDPYQGFYYIGGVFYAFDLDGKMYTDRFLYPYSFDRDDFSSSFPYHVDADGRGSNGWIRYDAHTEYYYSNGESHFRRIS